MIGPATLPAIGMTPAGAADAYARTDKGQAVGAADSSFGGALQRALDAAVQTGHVAEDKAMQAISGTGSLTEVVSAIAQAELTLQTATAVRDRVIQAYQDIIRMPI